MRPLSSGASTLLYNITMRYALMDSKALIEQARKDTGDELIKTRKEAILRLTILDLAQKASPLGKARAIDNNVPVPTDDELGEDDLTNTELKFD